MQQALQQAKIAFEEGEVPVGAVVVIENRIIARGHNQVETLNDATAHAEIIALTSAFSQLGSKYLPEATLYVTVEPCLMCTGALYWSKVSRIVWGADDDKNGHRHITGEYATQSAANWPFHQKASITKGILKEECAALMKSFFAARRNS